MLMTRDSTFQSTSVIADGRIDMLGSKRAYTLKFQSTSVIADGRIHDMVSRPDHYKSSFNPRPSLLTDESQFWPCSSSEGFSFNPRPSLLTDESPRSPSVSSSIACFNPRPSLLTDESGGARRGLQRGSQFQSTSVIADGRILACMLK